MVLWKLPSPAGTVVRSADAFATLLGLIPVIGIIPNAIGLLLNIILGDIIGSILSAGALVPFVGLLFSIAKLIYLAYFTISQLV